MSPARRMAGDIHESAVMTTLGIMASWPGRDGRLVVDIMEEFNHKGAKDTKMNDAWLVNLPKLHEAFERTTLGVKQIEDVAETLGKLANVGVHPDDLVKFYLDYHPIVRERVTEEPTDWMAVATETSNGLKIILRIMHKKGLLISEELKSAYSAAMVADDLLTHHGKRQNDNEGG